MHKALEDIFAEHDAPKHAGREKVMGCAKPLLAIASDVQRQIAEDRALLDAAESSPDLPDEFRGKIEMMHQTLSVKECALAGWQAAARELTRAEAQWDRYMAEARTDVARRIAAGPQPPNPARLTLGRNS